MSDVGEGVVRGLQAGKNGQKHKTPRNNAAEQFVEVTAARQED
jgi:hypothetical protein